MDLSKISDICVEDIDPRDAPDFVDAYISSADYDGVPMTDEELDYLNENERDFVYECVLNKIY